MGKETHARNRDSVLITARELARLMTVSERTIARLTSAGKIPGAMKIGGSRRFNKKKIMEWLDHRSSNK
jgi:excisionase family DNA binding protein